MHYYENGYLIGLGGGYEKIDDFLNFINDLTVLLGIIAINRVFITMCSRQVAIINRTCQHYQRFDKDKACQYHTISCWQLTILLINHVRHIST